jgi:hypothetical protein
MAGILEGILQGDVFLGEFAVEIWSVEMNRGYGRRGFGGNGHLAGWRAVIGVLEDSWDGVSS